MKKAKKVVKILFIITCKGGEIMENNLDASNIDASNEYEIRLEKFKRTRKEIKI